MLAGISEEVETIPVQLATRHAQRLTIEDAIAYFNHRSMLVEPSCAEHPSSIHRKPSELD
jgi:hypothetical protein